MPLLPRATGILIVGGGPAGASAAWQLARRGHEVTIIDRARFPRAKPCSEYVSPEGARLLDAMGALAELERDGAALTGMRVYTPGGRTIHGEFVSDHGFRGYRDTGLGIRRERLDPTLLRCAVQAGATLVEGARLVALLRDGDGVVCGATVQVEGERHDVRARVVIGADGLRSQVAALLGVTRRARWPRRHAFVAHYRGVEGISSLGEMHVRRDGYLGLADVGQGVTNVAVVVPRRVARSASGDAAGFLARFLAGDPAMAGRFAGAERVSAVQVTGPFASRARRAGAPGALLVGDAADFFDPFTGEGIFAALRGGELLAPFASAMLETRGVRESHALVGEYERARHAQFAGKWRVERLIGAAVGAPPLLELAARRLQRDRGLADLLVGVTGDFVPPSALLRASVLRRALFGGAPGAPHDEDARATAPSPALLHVHRP